MRVQNERNIQTLMLNIRDSLQTAHKFDILIQSPEFNKSNQFSLESSI